MSAVPKFASSSSTGPSLLVLAAIACPLAHLSATRRSGLRVTPNHHATATSALLHRHAMERSALPLLLLLATVRSALLPTMVRSTLLLLPATARSALPHRAMVRSALPLLHHHATVRSALLPTMVRSTLLLLPATARSALLPTMVRSTLLLPATARSALPLLHHHATVRSALLPTMESYCKGPECEAKCHPEKCTYVPEGHPHPPCGTGEKCLPPCHSSCPPREKPSTAVHTPSPPQKLVPPTTIATPVPPKTNEHETPKGENKVPIISGASKTSQTGVYLSMAAAFAAMLWL
ncbi:hypothetical protein V2G26_005641 [Clonostachys chloroleuca]